MSEQVSFEDMRRDINRLLGKLEDFEEFEECNLFREVLNASKSQVSKTLARFIIGYEFLRENLPEARRRKIRDVILLMVKDEAREWLNKYIKAMMGRMVKGPEIRDLSKGEWLGEET